MTSWVIGMVLLLTGCFALQDGLVVYGLDVSKETVGASSTMCGVSNFLNLVMDDHAGSCASVQGLEGECG